MSNQLHQWVIDAIDESSIYHIYSSITYWLPIDVFDHRLVMFGILNVCLLSTSETEKDFASFYNYFAEYEIGVKWASANSLAWSLA